MTRAGSEVESFALRAPTPALSAVYLAAWFGFVFLGLMLPTLMLDGFATARSEAAMRFSQRASFGLTALAAAVVSLLLALKRSSGSALVTPSSIRIPRGWLFEWMKEIPVSDVATCTVVGLGPMRRLVIETTDRRVYGCSAWWFESSEALDRIRSRLEADWERIVDDDARITRFRTTAALGAMTRANAMLGLVFVIWWILVFVVQSYLGDSRDPLVLTGLGGNASWLVASGEYERIFSSSALHAHATHLGLNVVVAWMIYLVIGSVLGWAGAAIVFLAGVLAAGSAFAMLSSSVAVGASGGIYGWLGAWFVCTLTRRERIGRPFILPVHGVLIIIGFQGLVQLLLPRVSVAGHLAAMIGGAAVALPLVGGRGAFPVGGPQSALVKSAGAASIALLVVIPTIALVRGAQTPLLEVASASIAAMRARDLRQGAALRPGLEICLSSEVGRELARSAMLKVGAVPAAGDARVMWRAMIGCLAFRLGDLELAWQMAHDASWRQPSAVASLVLGLVGREMSPRRLPPMVQGVDDGTPSVTRRGGGIEVRFDHAVSQHLGVYLALQQGRRIGSMSTRVDRSEEFAFISQDSLGCREWDLANADVALVAVSKWPDWHELTEPASWCWTLPDAYRGLDVLPAR